MSAAISLSDPLPPPLERARGALRVRIACLAGASALADLYQEGCLKARFPRVAPGAPVSVVLMNNSGGVAPGDRLASAIALGEAAAAMVASAGAERFYRGLPGERAAEVRHHLALGESAALEFLPQESILFDGAALDRTLSVEMAEGARLLAVEQLVFGRAAMGETVRRLRLVDRVQIRRGGRLVWHDAVRFAGDAAALMARPALGGGAGAAATVLLAAPDAAVWLEPLRAALEGAPCEAGATWRAGVLFARLLAADGAALRASVAVALAVLRAGAALPRNWRC